jgi:hypothetical protein
MASLTPPSLIYQRLVLRLAGHHWLTTGLQLGQRYCQCSNILRPGLGLIASGDESITCGNPEPQPFYLQELNSVHQDDLCTITKGLQLPTGLMLPILVQSSLSLASHSHKIKKICPSCAMQVESQWPNSFFPTMIFLGECTPQFLLLDSKTSPSLIQSCYQPEYLQTRQFISTHFRLC